MNEPFATDADREQDRPWHTFVKSRRFAWIHLACALIAGAIWYISDGRAGPWPLLIAGLPWLARLASGYFPLPQTRYDLLMAGFVASAAVGAWAGYDQALAWQKFWLIIGGTALFYALAGQRSANLWPILLGMALFGGAVSLYFMLTNDWNSFPAKIEFINRIGLRLMSIRPAALGDLHNLHPNVAGGIMAMMIPLSLAVVIRGVKKGRPFTALTAGIAIVTMGIGLALTTSRGAWIALLGGLFAWVLWSVAGNMSGLLYLSRRKTLGLALLLCLGAGLTVTLLAPGGLLGLLNRLPGPATAGSRISISKDAVDLAGDFWITGGGLASFEGLYSQYIEVIPFYTLFHAHNLFLNVTVEQGVLGLLFLASIILLSFWWLADPTQAAHKRSIRGLSLVSGATFATLVVLCLHGLVDDALFGSRGVLLLWLPAGLTALLFPKRKGVIETIRQEESPSLILLGVVIILVALILVLYRAPILSGWHANLGAIEMARVELADYPSGRWSDGHELASLAPAKAHFEHALAYNRNNRTAWHRLGLIAMLERDYESAKDALYNAYLLDNGHRGIRKALAFSYVWTNSLDKAIPLLLDIPEAQQELINYRGWWNEQGYPDFSQRAEEARILLLQQPSP